MPSKRRSPSAGSPRSKDEMLYGINSVAGAMQARRRRLARLYLKAGRPSSRLSGLRTQAEELGLTVTELSSGELEVLCGSSGHQGAVLACGALPVRLEAECLRLAGRGLPLLLVLDEVQDPQNFGAALRCCAVFGIDGMVLPRHHASPLSPAASKASAGYLESFPVYSVANLARFLGNCRKSGFWVAGTSAQGDTPLHTFTREQPLVVVMGNEARGLRPLVSRQCDFQIAIPTPGQGSLNVAAAAAVLLYQLTLPR
ncbi:MAG: 23S rRNA (guanosine(2251)-2'-O)-methyltransferase RlmB [SAR324 cluster bacterium]|nr:23S rRNA (guanosine(2251)-2'-O)-methyltransferase RlmB [SAR324 cluster bacterium]MCZ6730397.1 23S rRNA (guanosine(2251)-2'-O)-methyltransferase RlmB [SAR324 cluster bacterium]